MSFFDMLKRGATGAVTPTAAAPMGNSQTFTFADLFCYGVGCLTFAVADNFLIRKINS